jgi:hypothetical protein
VNVNSFNSLFTLRLPWILEKNLKQQLDDIVKNCGIIKGYFDTSQFSLSESTLFNEVKVLCLNLESNMDQ